MIVRPYANLLPERFRRPLYGAQFALAVCYLISFIAKYLGAATTPWAEGVRNLFFLMLGLNYLIWPNDSGIPPLASRTIGGLLAAGFLLILVTDLIRYT